MVRCWLHTSPSGAWVCRGRRPGFVLGKREALLEREGKRKVKKVRAAVQRALYCRCGRGKVLALGMCATCYTLKRQDEEYFGGLREQVLRRDGYCCRVCGASERGKRSIVVHHRIPGISKLPLMISLCPACHAIVSRTRVMRRPIPPLLLELWREQHPNGHEQTIISFEGPASVAVPVPLFASPNTPY